ncbi:MAG TPA: serine/threonine-protein kinase [Kofleriaceae bacterium]
MIGEILDGRYEVIAKLGQGGMGTVYRARQVGLSREVAVKVLNPALLTQVDSIARFMREAKLGSLLAHPNTVAILDFGRDQSGHIYLVMELLRGRTLHDVIAAAGPLAATRVARIGIQLTDALEAAHALSIVHRDLKPENVMLLDVPGDRDLVKVLDFGLARSVTDPSSRATATGTFAGTPRYLAPEVFDGAEPAPAQDLYALGVVLGELARGRSLWDAPTMESLLATKLSGRPPPLDGVEPELRELIVRLLAPRPSARPTYAEVRARLAALGAAPPATALALEPTGVLAVEPPSAAFAPPRTADQQLELEPEWQRERAARIAAATAPPRRAPRRRVVATVVALALAGAAIAAVALVAGRSAQPATIVLSVTAHAPVAITVDGKPAGVTPVQVPLPRGDHPVAIGATIGGRPIVQEVVPDRDRVILLH